MDEIRKKKQLKQDLTHIITAVGQNTTSRSNIDWGLRMANIVIAHSGLEIGREIREELKILMEIADEEESL